LKGKINSIVISVLLQSWG